MPKTRKNTSGQSLVIRFEDFVYAKEVREAAKVFERSSIDRKNNGWFKLTFVKSFRKSGNSKIWEFGHFELDETGLVVQAPEKLARKFVQKVRITGIESIISEFRKRYGELGVSRENHSPAMVSVA